MTDEDLMKEVVSTLRASGYSDEAVDYARAIKRRTVNVADKLIEEGRNQTEAEWEQRWSVYPEATKEEADKTFIALTKVVGHETDNEYRNHIGYSIGRLFSPWEKSEERDD